MKKKAKQEDVSFEDEDLQEEHRDAHIAKLKEKLAVCLEERKEYLDGWQRAKADLINDRKERREREVRRGQIASEELLLSLIPVLDSFDMARGDQEAWQRAPEEWRTGIEQIRSQLLDILSARGLRAMQTLGEPFDPEKHESVKTSPGEGASGQAEIVTEVLQQGYVLHDRVLRPAKVCVGHAKN